MSSHLSLMLLNDFDSMHVSDLHVSGSNFCYLMTIFLKCMSPSCRSVT